METTNIQNPPIVLPKGESIKFLGFTIKNFPNNDGVVLLRHTKTGIEHCGSYGSGTLENIDTAKRHAILYFMVFRPNNFATVMVRKAYKHNGGTYGEYYLLKDVVESEGWDFPSEITTGNGSNAMIYYKGEPLTL